MNRATSLAYENRTAAIGYPAHNPYAPNTNPNVRIKVSNKKQRAAQKRAHIMSLLKIAGVMCLAFLVLYRGLMITDRNSAVEKKQEALAALVTSNEKLQFEIDRSLDLKNVETIARDELGMRRAEKYQTVYLDLEKSDYVEKVAKDEFSFLNQVGDFFGGLLAYLD